jgi:hypothetical protein
MWALKRAITSFEENTDDVENVLYKEYLKPSIAATIVADTGLPREFVDKVVEVIYLSEDC